MNTYKNQLIEHPVIGGIYRDESERSFAVLNIADNVALLEYADGTLATVGLHHWPQLHPKQAVF